MAKTRGAAGLSSTDLPVREPSTEDLTETEHPWKVVVWNDPINLMSYVTWVFQTLFGYSRPKAQKLMREVHEQGRSIVWHGDRARAEGYCSALHDKGLWATLEQDA